MARQIVACPSCKAKFDVSAFRPGSKIRCGSCFKILRIPGNPGPKAQMARPVSGPTAASPPPKKVQPKPKTAPQPEPEAAPAPETGTVGPDITRTKAPGAAQKPKPEPKKKSDSSGMT